MKERVGVGCAASGVQECALRIDGLADEGEEFLHAVEVMALGKAGLGGSVPERMDVSKHIGERGNTAGASAQEVLSLAKNPRIANGGASDHDAVGLGKSEDFGGFGGGGDIAIGEDWAAHMGFGLADTLIIDLAAVHLADGTTVDGQGVDFVGIDEVEDLEKMAIILKADAHFDGKAAGRGVAQRCENLLDSGGFTEQAAADLLTVDLGCGAAHIQVDAGDGQACEIACGTGEVFTIVADQLCEHGASGIVVEDGIDNVRLQRGLGVDAEILGDKKIRWAECAEQAHEGKVGHILHWGEGGQRAPGLNWRWQHGRLTLFLQDALEQFGHVLLAVKQLAGSVDGPIAPQGHGDGIAGP